MPKRKRSQGKQGSRVLDLKAKSFATASALASILSSVSEEGLPDAFSRASQYRARKDLCETSNYYGQLTTTQTLQLQGGKDITVGFQNPFAFLHHCCEHSQSYAAIVQNAVDEHPPSLSSPWHIILYQDGVDPSDGLAKNKSRHLVVFYWSFLEFGMDALCHEEVWATATVMRTNKAKKLPGGITELTHRVVEQFHQDVHDMSVTGVNVLLPGKQTHSKLIGNVQILMSDVPALTEMLSSKGHKGLKPCPVCKNATHHHQPPGGAVPIHT